MTIQANTEGTCKVKYETLYSRVVKGTPLDVWQRPGYRGHP